MEICAPFSQNHNQQKQEPNHPYKNLPTKRKETIKGPITKKKKKGFDCLQGLTDKYRSCDADEVLHKTDLGNERLCRNLFPLLLILGDFPTLSAV
jgi:hypothetical protein